ncbi:hypothetical protein M1555_03515 [Patescibacteria group bacterium]|nr:hypothetical protein [Patescibacteria group bacterium]
MKGYDGSLTYVTLAYADIFAYPMTKQELLVWGYAGAAPDTRSRLIGSKTVRGRTYYFLRGRSRTVSLRLDREHAAAGKWLIARHAARVLGFLPTVRLVGVTGGLSMNNAPEDEDIDFMCIVSPKTLWISRLFITLAAELLHLRRRPGSDQVKDTVCLNMFMDEHAPAVPPGERDFFSAHEVLQMRPVVAKEDAYLRFLRANAWAGTYLPTAWAERMAGASGEEKDSRFRRRQGMVSELLSLPGLCYAAIGTRVLRVFEYPAMYLQLCYMRKRKTQEVTTPTLIRFHPRDTREIVKKEFARRLRKVNIPLDKIFYGI